MTGRKYRLYPAAEHLPKLKQWIGCTRAINNAKAEEERYLSWLRRFGRFSARRFDPDDGESSFVFDQKTSHLKPSKDIAPWFHEVPAQIYRNAMYQRSQAWARHWADPQHVGRPGRRRKGEGDSILLTKELFQFWGEGLIFVGTKTNMIGVLEFTQHRECGEPNSVTISRDKCDRWWLSFTFDDGVETPTGKQLLEKFDRMTLSQIAETTVGFDRGIVQQVTGSDGKVYGYTEAKKLRFEKYQRRIRALQKKLSRQKNKQSRRRAKTRIKLAKAHQHVVDLRVDSAHQVSKRIVESTPATVLAFEKLNLRGMTRRAKPVRSNDGEGYLPNGAAAKTGLNRSMHHQALGAVLRFTKYKAARAGRLVIEVNPAGTSQECHCCGHTEPANRKGIKFTCKKCGHTAHADANASDNIKRRGVVAVLSALGRCADQPFAEATMGVLLLTPPGATEASIRSPHLAA